MIAPAAASRILRAVAVAAVTTMRHALRQRPHLYRKTLMPVLP